MKHILAPILLLTLLFPTFAFGETMKDLVERDGIHYKKFTDVPFTGKVTGEEQGKFRNGKKHGPWAYYYDNGQLWTKGNYKKGKEHGPWVYYNDNGQLSMKGNYKNGRKHGLWEEWDVKSGYKGHYKNGKKEGLWKKLSKELPNFIPFNIPVGIEPGTYKDGVKVSD